MTSVDWDEVKRLAADFQLAQLSSSSLALSERNCVEIINKLIELKLLDVIYTTDGKEYITPQYLVKEIKDELYVSGGRINLIELSKSLNVDLSHVSAKAVEVERNTSGCQILNGQLIDKNYITVVAQEINDRLKTQGKININDLTRVYDLPSDFLQNIVEKNLGKAVEGKQDKVDPRLFFTDAFVDRNKAIVRGSLAALSQPTLVSTILQMTEIEERDFYSAFDVLNDAKEIVGALTAKQGTNTMYIPYVYTKQQSDWVDNFYKQNGYLEYDAITRLGISDPVSFIRRHFPSGNLVELKSCAIGPQLISQVNDSIEETIISGSYLDLTMLLPSVFSPDDVMKVMNNALKILKTKGQVHTFSETYLVTEKFLQDLTLPFHQTILKKKAEEAVSSGAYIQSVIEKKMARGGGEHEDTKIDKKEERRKKASSGKGGGGTQGRETKTRSTKKKQIPQQKGKGDESDEEVDKKAKPNSGYLELISTEDVEEVLKENKALADEEGTDLIPAIATYLQPTLNKLSYEMAAEEYNRSLLSGSGNRRKIHSDLQEKVETLTTEIRLAERGLKALSADVQSKLVSHLLKTTCLDLLNSLCLYISEADHQNLTPEMRNKIINEVTGEGKETMLKLNKSLTSTIDEYLSNLEAALPHIDLIYRKPDKKKEKNYLLMRRESLLSEIAQSNEAASVLHLSVLLLLQYMTQNVICAPPKFVPILLPLLKNFLSLEDYEQLTHFQELVLKLLTTEDPDVQNEIKGQLNENITSIRTIVVNYKKHSSDK